MRSIRWVVPLCVIVGLGGGSTWAQTPPLTIHNVTLQEATGTLTISGVGLPAAPVVTVDGQPVTVLLGGTHTQIDVEAPAAIWTTPGSYRLTVTDARRRVADTFVVATQPPAVVAVGGVDPGVSQIPARRTSSSASRGTAERSVGESPGPNTSVSPTLVENSCLTAFGQLALSASVGCRNTAIGYSALRWNTTGESNTASGDSALYSNTTGLYNTAAGARALFNNSIGSGNTAAGVDALYSNVTGNSNTASGRSALEGNTSGSDNTATGYRALLSNSTGFNNTAAGSNVLSSNTIGFENTASGVYALIFNTTGSQNTAAGLSALEGNTTGFQNTATGVYALAHNSEGTRNTAVGFNAGANVTIGSHNVYLGADVAGAAADANTMRLGRPYDGASGQNRTFIAGVHGTEITGGVPVVIDANGQLGVRAAPQTGGVTPPATPAGMTSAEREQMAALAALVEMQQTAIDGQRTTIEELRAALGVQQTRSAEQQAANAQLRVALEEQQARLTRLEALIPRGRK